MDVTRPLHEFNKTSLSEKPIVSGMFNNSKTVRNALMSLRTEEEFSLVVADVNHKIDVHEIGPIKSPRFIFVGIVCPISKNNTSTYRAPIAPFCSCFFL